MRAWESASTKAGTVTSKISYELKYKNRIGITIWHEYFISEIDPGYEPDLHILQIITENEYVQAGTTLCVSLANPVMGIYTSANFAVFNLDKKEGEGDATIEDVGYEAIGVIGTAYGGKWARNIFGPHVPLSIKSSRVYKVATESVGTGITKVTQKAYSFLLGIINKNEDNNT